jgi:hypothetical protein
MKILIPALMVTLCMGVAAQSRHDPLNPHEIEQMRASAQEPARRIELLVAFARDRALAVERLRAMSAPNGVKIGDLLTEFAAIIDELDDNLDMYNSHSEDLRRPLKRVLQAEEEFQQKLKAFDSTTPLQKREFAAALDDATDSLDSSSNAARRMLADQIAKKGEEKVAEKEARQGGKKKNGDGQPPPDDSSAGQNPLER